MVGARRILPAGWAAYVASPTPQAVIGYGASFFTNAGPSLGAIRRRAAGAPADSFFALGNSGQVVLIVPSRHLVIVSLGFALDASNRGPVYGVLELLAHVRS
jgi:CubicO group peptidase (beta-lactamase class C family)